MRFGRVGGFLHDMLIYRLPVSRRGSRAMRNGAAGMAKRVRGLGRLGAWLAVFALLFQMLVPVSAAQAAFAIDQELAASICHSSSDGPASGSASDTAQHDHCQFCQLQLGTKLAPPPAAAARPIRPATALLTVVSPAAEAFGLSSVHQPQSRRGPPSFS